MAQVQRKLTITGFGMILTMVGALLAPLYANADNQAEQNKTVRLTYARGGGNITLLAKERGELDKRLASQGIRVEWVGPFPGHAQSIQAVVGRSADFSFGGSTTPGVAAILAGSPVAFTQFYIYLPRTSAIIAKDDSGINKFEDLIGKTVAVNRSGLGEVLFVAALEKHNIERDKIKTVYLNAADAAAALGAGKVDAWSWWSPAIDIARQNYKAHNVFEEKDLDALYDFNSFLVHKDFARQHPDIVKAVSEAFAAEGEWASAHPQEVEAVSQKAGKYSDEIKNYFISLNRSYQFFKPNDEDFLKQFQFAVDWLTKHRILQQKVNVKEYVIHE
ncbi:ABC transporter substrate-binding protein [Brenneria tiliae]|uniref:ABC transporter substrate-binding protein n=1 Tax=Brenneria tiliae TaxID=2914984 RepID=UPI002014D3BE|nr:NrtA/SsuA/CpmA family ABC transporter substrate-binding protein [Brenneria tiliae]MCL2898054.1 NrtA/SsuA/CpmA family ABC transporter substrate-binding protein [Brenneria tiliae]MCL2902135.1 NrtA/SsuA/CpmA family ABC transporter substrate-binding protein [Brenneria tiliae]